MREVTRPYVQDFARRMHALKDPRKRRGFIHSLYVAVIHGNAIAEQGAKQELITMLHIYGFTKQAARLQKLSHEEELIKYAAAEGVLSLIKDGSNIKIPIVGLIRLVYTPCKSWFDVLIPHPRLRRSIRRPVIFLESGDRKSVV